jgi:hypothetical protein
MQLYKNNTNNDLFERINELKVGTHILYVHSDTSLGGYSYVNNSVITHIFKGANRYMFELEQKNLCGGSWIISFENILDILDYKKISKKQIKIGHRYIAYDRKFTKYPMYLDITIKSIKNACEYDYLDSYGNLGLIPESSILRELSY